MVKENLKTETIKESSVSIMTDEDEELTGNQCPRCGYPTVLEYGLEVCYGCGWSKED